MLDFLKGKKTFIIAFVTAALAACDALGYVVPPYVYAILAALGLTTARIGTVKAP